MDKRWDRVLELFYEYPDRVFTIREIAKKTRVPKSTMQRYVRALREKGLVSKEHRAVPSTIFKVRKTHHYIEKLFDSGLIDRIEEQLKPSCIILFGSFRKGESVHDSDIDLFVETTEKKTIDLAPFERKLGHRIQLFREARIAELPEHLRNNVVNGIKLGGFFTLQ